MTALVAPTHTATLFASRAEAHGTLTEAGTPLEKLLRNRLHRCMALLPKVLSEDDANAVHALRVSSRRLQQVIFALCPDLQQPAARAMLRALRRERRSLSGWRDCDVLIALVERKARHTRNLDQKHAWNVIRDLLLERRARQMRRARRRLGKRKFFALAQYAQKLVQQRSTPDGRANPDPLATLPASVSVAYAQWREGLSGACESLAAGDIHAFRIQTKRLRYRIELVRDLGSSAAQVALASLKTLQGELGRWHDSTEMARAVAEALADPQFLLQHPRATAAILRNIDRNNALQLARIRRLLAATQEGVVEHSVVHNWIAGYCGETLAEVSESARA
jgi:CHAD domain-containing protein